MVNQDYVTASEINEYVFCKRVWWLRLNGKVDVTSRMAEGSIDHDAIADTLSLLKKKSNVGRILIAVGIIGMMLLGIILIRFPIHT